MAHTTKHGQIALEFLISYAIAILIIGIALGIIAYYGFFNPPATPTSCTPAPPFSCISYEISSNGVLTAVISQTSGVTLTINGAACATTPSGVGSGPGYGNIGTLPYSKAMQYYPDSSLSSGLSIASDGIGSITVNCYDQLGVATASPGTAFIGYLWLNYSSAGVLNTGTVQQAAAFSMKYSR